MFFHFYPLIAFNPFEAPDKQWPYLVVLGVLATVLKIAFYIIKIAKEFQQKPATQKKRRTTLLLWVNKQISKHPWITPAVSLGSTSLLMVFMLVLAYQGWQLSKAVGAISQVTLPGASNNNINRLESNLRDMLTRLEKLEADGAQPTQSNPNPPKSAATEFKLVWFNHFEPAMLYQVNRTETSKSEVKNDEFRTWCSPFNEQDYIIQERYLVAADEQFKDVPGKGKENWWTAAAYNNNPSLRIEWLKIMDDERWYVYKVIPRN